MGLNVNGEVMIFKGDYGYSTTISNKKQDGTYDKMYLQLQLPKDVELENKTKINITKAFLSFYKSKEGLAKPKIVVQEYQTTENNSDNMFNGSDLPF